MNIAMILSGGVGARMGADIPKQFIKVLGKPVIAYTLEVFQNNSNIDWIEVVCHADYSQYLGKIIDKHNYFKVKLVVEASSTYQQSVINGLNGLRDICQSDDNVLIHFGVSPFVSDEEIDDSLRVCEKYGNAVAANPSYLCLCNKDNNISSVESLDRDLVMGLNSPQTFRFDILQDMYDVAARQGILTEIDPHTTSLMFALGMRLYFSKSSQRNIKITTQEDLELFEGYVMLRNKQKEGGRIDDKFCGI